MLLRVNSAGESNNIQVAGGPAASSLIIAGDGNAYVAYRTQEGTAGRCTYQGADAGEMLINHLMLLRVSSSGAYDRIPVHDWNSCYQELNNLDAYMISNGDTGVLLTWEQDSIDESPFGMALTNGASSTVAIGAIAPGQQEAVTPVLQAQDGSFVGTVGTANGSFVQSMIAFDSSGNVRWTVPNESPQYATADGGVIGQSGITYDQNGNATGQGPPYTQSWTYNKYQDGPLTQVAAMPTLLASTWAFQLQTTAAKPLPDSVKANTDQLVVLGREIDYYPFQGNNYWGDISDATVTITEYLINVSGAWPPRGCNAPGYNPNANETFCSYEEKEFDDLITTGFVRRQQMWVQLPNVRNYKVPMIYPCTAQNTFGNPVRENLLSATNSPILVNGVAGSRTKRTCTQ